VLTTEIATINIEFFKKFLNIDGNPDLQQNPTAPWAMPHPSKKISSKFIHNFVK